MPTFISVHLRECQRAKVKILFDKWEKREEGSSEMTWGERRVFPSYSGPQRVSADFFSRCSASERNPGHRLPLCDHETHRNSNGQGTKREMVGPDGDGWKTEERAGKEEREAVGEKGEFEAFPLENRTNDETLL